MNKFDIVNSVNMEIFRLDSLLKAMRISGCVLTEKHMFKDITLPAEDFTWLFDIAIDRLNLIKEHVDEIDSAISAILKGDSFEK